MASPAEIANISVTDTAVHKRFTLACAEFLRRLLEEMTAVVVEAAEPVPLEVVQRLAAVILEDSSIVPLPDELQEVWTGCGGNHVHTQASLKLHVRREFQRASLRGSALTHGRHCDQRMPLNEEAIVPDAVSVQDLSSFRLGRMRERRQARAWSLTRWQSGTAISERP